MKIIANKNIKVGHADPLLYGHFLEHHHRQVYGGVYDPASRFADADGFREDVLEAMKRIRTPIIRWPGGCYVSAYDWKYGVGKDRKPTYDKAWRVEESNEFGTDEYIRLCRKLGCAPYICTNAGTGTAQEMSDWLEYCNLENEGLWAKQRIANGFPEPHNVRYWSVGNENYGDWEMGAKDSDEWGRLVRESCKLLLRVDPSVELSAASNANLDWNMNLLKYAGKYLNWISIHGYWDFSPDGIHHASYDEAMLRSGADISDSIDKVRAYLTAFGLQKQVRIAFDEWNLRGWFHPNLMDNPHRPVSKEEYLLPRDRNDNNSVYTMADAVFAASFLNICLRNADLVGMACFSPIVNTRGAIFTHKDGLVLRPTYYVFDLYANLMKSEVLDVWAQDVPTLSGTDQGKRKTVNKVDTVVTYGDGEYAVAAVNKDSAASQAVELSFPEDEVKLMRIHTLNGGTVDDYNDIGRDHVKVTTSDWMPYTGKFTLAPHSVNIIELK